MSAVGGEREHRIFAGAAISVGLLGAYQAFVPILRLKSKLGSWEYAREFIAAEPFRWCGQVVVRFFLLFLLLWIAARFRRRKRWAVYVFLALTPLLMAFIDLMLWTELYF